MGKRLFEGAFEHARTDSSPSKTHSHEGPCIRHTGKPQSFVYDIADISKFETVVPVAFRTAARKPHDAEREVRLACEEKSAAALPRVREKHH